MKSLDSEISLALGQVLVLFFQACWSPLRLRGPSLDFSYEISPVPNTFFFLNGGNVGKSFSIMGSVQYISIDKV